MPTFTYQWERDDGDVAGATGSVFCPSPGEIQEQYIPISGDIGHEFRLRATDGVNTYESPWTTATVDTPIPVGGGSLVPAPPGSYHATGNITWSTPIGSGSGIYTLFFPNGQKIVVTSTGVIFVCYSSLDAGGHDPTSWKLVRSNDDGASWSLIWDSAAKSDPQYGIAPILEIDQGDNVYLFANYYPIKGESLSATRMYKFSASNNWAAPSAPKTLTSNASGKWHVFLDQTRSWIWIVFWSFSGSGTNLMAFDYNGNTVYARNMFKPFTRMWTPTLSALTDLHAASAHYPQVFVDYNGVVYLGWNSIVCESPFTSFYDVRTVYSPGPFTGTETWFGPTNGVNGAGGVSARNIPFCTDDSSSSLAERAFQIVKTSNLDEFIPVSNSNYGVGSGQKANYNRLYHMVYNQGALHYYYESNSSHPNIIQHHSYARQNLSTHMVADSERRTPAFHIDSTTDGDKAGASGGEGGGNFIQGSDMESRLYFAQKTSSDADGKIRILKSGDVSASGIGWYNYATSPAVSVGSNGLLGVQGYRYVLPNGDLYGLAALGDSPYTLRMWKAVPA